MPELRVTKADVVRVDSGVIDVKLDVGGVLRLLRWRRRFWRDEVSLDGRVVQTAAGIFNRETVFGLSFDDVEDPDAPEQRVLFTIDPKADWFDMRNWLDARLFRRPAGVRLETAATVFVAFGSLAIGSPRPAGQAAASEADEKTWSVDGALDRLLRGLGL